MKKFILPALVLLTLPFVAIADNQGYYAGTGKTSCSEYNVHASVKDGRVGVCFIKTDGSWSFVRYTDIKEDYSFTVNDAIASVSGHLNNSSSGWIVSGEFKSFYCDDSGTFKVSQKKKGHEKLAQNTE